MAGNISENMMSVTDRVVRAARKAGRDPAEITLVAASKGQEVKRLKEAITGGGRIFGENYVKEAAEKIKKLKDGSLKWHFIGHLQKNKVKDAVELFDVIETVDSVELAQLINKRAKKPIDIFIEVNIGGEETKYGVTIKNAVKLAKSIAGLENITLKGLMAIPPTTESPEQARPYFITLRRLAERINKLRIPGVSLRDLSMGMSGDFEVAIEEGATIVRVGTSIFGPREEKVTAPKGPEPKKAPAKKAEKPVKKPAKKAEKKEKPAAKAGKKAAPKTTAKAKKAAPAKAKKKPTKAAKAEKAERPAKAAKKTVKAPKKAAAKKPAAKPAAKATKKAAKKPASTKSSAKGKAPEKTGQKKTGKTAKKS